MPKSKHTPVQVQFIADSLLPGFIPKDKTEVNLSFAFTADNCNYEVVYSKNNEGNWIFTSYRNV